MADLNKKNYKTPEQIKKAQQTIKLLQDYAELSKTENKLNDIDNKKALQERIDATTKEISTNIEGL